MIDSTQFKNDKFAKLARIINSSDFPQIVKTAVSEYLQSSEIEKDDEGQYSLGKDQWFGFTDDLKLGVFDFDFESDKITYQHLLMPVGVSDVLGFRIYKDTKINIKAIVKKYRNLVDELNSNFLEFGDNAFAFQNGLCPLENVIQSPKAREDTIKSYYFIPVWKVEDAQTFIDYINQNWNNLIQPEKDVRIFLKLMLKQRQQFNLEDYQKLTNKFSVDELIIFFDSFTNIVSFKTEKAVISRLFTKKKIKELLITRATIKCLSDDDSGEVFGLSNFFKAWSEGNEQFLTIEILLDGNSDITRINQQLRNLGKMVSSIPQDLFNIKIVIATDDNTVLSLLNSNQNISKYFDLMKELARNLTFIISEDTVSKLKEMQEFFETNCKKWFTQVGKEQFEKIMNPNLIVLNQFLQQNQQLVEVKNSKEVNDEADTIKDKSVRYEGVPSKFMID